MLWGAFFGEATRDRVLIVALHLRHGGLLFLKTDREPPNGRAGPVWSDSHGLGLWVAHRGSMVLVEQRR